VLGDDVDQLSYSRLGRLTSGAPESVMDVFAPEFAVIPIEVVVVGSDRRSVYFAEG
jgi:hypothetical protein